MKKAHKEFLDDLAKLFKKHNVTGMYTLDTDSYSENEQDIQFDIGNEAIVVNCYNYSHFISVSAPEDYYPDSEKTEETKEVRFESLSCGERFKWCESYNVKIKEKECLSSDHNENYRVNAVNLETGELGFFEPSDYVKVNKE